VCKVEVVGVGTVKCCLLLSSCLHKQELSYVVIVL
jgi:hypothetical protein